MLTDYPRYAAYHVLLQTIGALMRADGQSGIPAHAAAEATLVRAIVGAERYTDGLLLIDVLAALSDRQLTAWIPRFEGMCAYAGALADYREARRLDQARRTLRRSLWAGLARFTR